MLFSISNYISPQYRPESHLSISRPISFFAAIRRHTLAQAAQSFPVYLWIALKERAPIVGINRKTLRNIYRKYLIRWNSTQSISLRIGYIYMDRNKIYASKIRLKKLRVNQRSNRQPACKELQIKSLLDIPPKATRLSSLFHHTHSKTFTAN